MLSVLAGVAFALGLFLVALSLASAMLPSSTWTFALAGGFVVAVAIVAIVVADNWSIES